MFFFLQAEDITLTVGQAFDLAYQNFMQGSGKELELKKQVINLQKKVRCDCESEYQKIMWQFGLLAWFEMMIEQWYKCLPVWVILTKSRELFK